MADTLVLEGAEMVGVTIRLEEDPIPLEGIEVVVEQRSLGLERAGFYDRLDRSGISGTRITRWDIEQRTGARVSDLLRNVPSTQMMSLPSPGAAVMRVNRVGNRNFALMPSGLPGCEPTVYVDGLRYRDSGAAEYAADSPFAVLRVRNLNFLSAETIEGIEAYTGLAAPAQFNDDDCGVVLIWTRGYR
jgi:outer membrane receptor for ferrienterochelin and colicin